MAAIQKMFALLIVFLCSLDLIFSQSDDSCRAGDILRRDEDYGEAVHAFAQCQLLYPTSIGSNLNLAMALISTGRTKKARAVLENILSMTGHTHVQATSTLVDFDLQDGLCNLAIARIANASSLLQSSRFSASTETIRIAQKKTQAILRCLPLSENDQLHLLSGAVLTMIQLSPASVKSWGLLCATIVLLATGIMLLRNRSKRDKPEEPLLFLPLSPLGMFRNKLQTLQ